MKRRLNREFRITMQRQITEHEDKKKQPRFLFKRPARTARRTHFVLVTSKWITFVRGNSALFSFLRTRHKTQTH